ncbi:MAG: dicarboxylate/amino acid:cation symporter [Bacteroidales bacterium]|nr:dicarboxylate/amino acid:cation symporter [Bacteroidales bacterium]MBR3411420.1 dicarboxylate/amino acid:cation symporter [Bacteroidales bacterium]
MKKFGILPKILIAIALGIVCSFFFPGWAVRVFLTFNSIFSNFLGMFIPLLIIGLVAPGIADLGKGAGKLLLITVVLAYSSTVLSGAFSYFSCKLAYPHILGNGLSALSNMDMSNTLTPYFTIEMPAFISVTTALVVAFILGLTTATITGTTMRGFLVDFRDVVTTVITKVIIPCLPLYIFGIFLQMGAEGHVGAVLGAFLKIVGFIFLLHVTELLFLFFVAGPIAHKNPFKALVTMLPAYVTALGTASSAATIPVTLQQAIKNGVREETASFTVPLCATIHMPCSILKITAVAYAITLSMGLPSDFGTYIGFIMMLAITMVAAPGVPGGAIMAALGLLSSMLGFDSNMQGLMIAIYIAMDSFGTAGNVTGDGAIALIVDRIRGDKKEPEATLNQ